MTQHIITARQLRQKDVEKIFKTADRMKRMVKENAPFEPVKKGLVILFFQRSTRTHATFELAAKLSNIPILYTTQAADQFSSVAKGESFDDTIRLFVDFCGVKSIVIRHPDEHSALKASEIANPFNVSIINAGDGTNEHPTQALLDLYTIDKHRDSNVPINKVRIVVANDIEYSRTIRSLLILHSKIHQPDEVGICSPPGIHLPDDIRSELIREGVKIIPFHNLAEAAQWADFLYMTRPQIEYYARSIVDEEEKKLKIQKMKSRFENFRVTRSFMENLPPDCGVQIMHPMPIDTKHFNEIVPEVREHPRCIIFQQARNGLFIRMALLDKIFRG